ncbi:hypothetical protein DB30_01596 [Enhygromyxa salina]|uniref:Uncharacterized protein n=1 Tax=Enhygromyxa salina TaxID=215803 RepID=A0A0C1ZMQ3_9BACT|nr:hypothetical protein DB30_01596 [Enhygromyxa salina]
MNEREQTERSQDRDVRALHGSTVGRARPRGQLYQTAIAPAPASFAPRAKCEGGVHEEPPSRGPIMPSRTNGASEASDREVRRRLWGAPF